MSPIDLLDRVYRLPPAVQRPVMSLSVGAILPITRGLGLRALEIDDDHAVTRMPRTRRGRNHVGGIYLGALTIQAEVTMALWALGQNRPPAFRTLVKRLETDFRAQARHAVIATCTPRDDEKDAVRAAAALEPGGKHEAWVAVASMCEESERLVCESRFLLSIKRV